jgi:hypothetical protein
MRPLLTLLFGILPLTLVAAETFPGLKSVLTEAEWKRSGLDRLTPDQIGVIDAALIKHFIHATHAATTAAVAPSQPPEPTVGASPAETAAAKSRFWEKFGIGKSSGTDWRSQPPMTAKVTAWRGSNGFVLDNGQIWEGLEAIPFDLPGNTVTIEARPMGAFALKLNENSVAVRVRRVK